MNLSKKSESINPAITLSLTAKAREIRASGVDVIDFSSGEPDFETPEYLKKVAIGAINEGNGHSESAGILPLRKAIAEKLLKDNDLTYDYDQIIVCHGAKHGLNNALFAILNDGDEVIIPAPYWASYPEIVKKCGGIPVFVQTRKEDGFRLTKENIEKAITNKTKAIIINSPNNPTGMVYTRGELEEIATIVVKNDMLVVSDELYEKLIYSNKAKHISIASLNKDIYDRTIVVNGFSKAYGLTGWRIGYTASNKEIAKIIDNLQSHTTSSVNLVSQKTALAALTSNDESLEKNLNEFKIRRDYTAQRISDIPLLSSLLPKGAFYLFIDVSKLFGAKIDDVVIKDSEDFAKILLDRYNVCVVPCNKFGYDEYIRLSYATSMENIVEGLNRIEVFIKQNF